MCLIVFAWQQHREYPLLLAANRDEFHARPTAAADFWNDVPQVLAGRDLQAGGTWLGISRSGRFAAITNIRDPQARERVAARSRGDLTRNFLTGNEAPRNYLDAIASTAGDYQGFNLLVGDRDSLWYLHASAAAAPKARELAPGIYGLSNAALDVPWPKVSLARRQLQDAVDGAQTPTHATLRGCLSDRSLAQADALAQQQLTGEMTRQLSAQFIVTERYGTRCTSTLRRRADGTQDFCEQRFNARGERVGSDSFELQPQAH